MPVTWYEISAYHSAAVFKMPELLRRESLSSFTLHPHCRLVRRSAVASPTRRQVALSVPSIHPSIHSSMPARRRSAAPRAKACTAGRRRTQCNPSTEKAAEGHLRRFDFARRRRRIPVPPASSSAPYVACVYRATTSSASYCMSSSTSRFAGHPIGGGGRCRREI